jgi:exopolyphosphatase/pppGpp-phosphohydrolase
MSYVFKRVLSLFLIYGLLSVSFVHADANADLKEVHNFQLTEKRLEQFIQAVRNMSEAAEKNPDLAKQDNSVGANASISEMVAAFDKIPPLKKSVEAAGMSTREFVLFQMALFSAGMGHYLVQQGKQLPPEFSTEQVAFYKAHEEKFKALQKEWEAMDKKIRGKNEDSEDEEQEDSEE